MPSGWRPELGGFRKLRGDCRVKGEGGSEREDVLRANPRIDPDPDRRGEEMRARGDYESGPLVRSVAVSTNSVQRSISSRERK